jgi:putative transcriptional regulator
MPTEKTKKIFLKHLGERIAQIRDERGLNHSELAAKCDKDRQSINRLEKGNVNPSVFYLLQIAKALDISLSELLDFAE